MLVQFLEWDAITLHVNISDQIYKLQERLWWSKQRPSKRQPVLLPAHHAPLVSYSETQSTHRHRQSEELSLFVETQRLTTRTSHPDAHGPNRFETYSVVLRFKQDTHSGTLECVSWAKVGFVNSSQGWFCCCVKPCWTPKGTPIESGMGLWTKQRDLTSWAREWAGKFSRNPDQTSTKTKSLKTRRWTAGSTCGFKN